METCGFIMPAVGLEPTRCCHQQILSLPRLPIPTCRREQILYYHKTLLIASIFSASFLTKVIIYDNIISGRDEMGEGEEYG